MAAPNTFSDKTGQIALTLIDENFEYVDTSLSTLQTNINSVQTQLNNLDLTTLEGNTEITGNLTVPTLFADAIESGTIRTSNYIYFGGAALIASAVTNPIATTTDTNIDHLWYNDSPSTLGKGGTWHFCADTTYKNTGNAQITAGAIEVDKLHSPGTIVQVQTATSGPARQTINSTSPVAISGLSIAFTPKFSTSKIIIISNVVHTKGHVVSFGYYKGSAKVVSTSGYTNTNEPNMNVTYYAGNDNNQLVSSTIMHEENATSTSARTYTLRATAGWNGGNYTVYINNRSSNDMASFSYMTVYEVAQ